MPRSCLRSVRGRPSPPPSRARDPIAAEALFERGKQLVEQGHTAEACAAFAESQRLDPAGGTLLRLALCHEASGQAGVRVARVPGGRAASASEGTGEPAKLAGARAPRARAPRRHRAPGAEARHRRPRRHRASTGCASRRTACRATRARGASRSPSIRATSRSSRPRRPASHSGRACTSPRVSHDNCLN